MNKSCFNLLVLALLVILYSFHHPKGEIQLFKKEHFKSQKWYAMMLKKLNLENQIDTSDAKFIKSFSSLRSVSSEEPAISVVKRYGPAEEKDILEMFSLNESEIGIFTGPYCHLFRYNMTTNNLLRVKNLGPIFVSEDEVLHFNQSKGGECLFYAEIKTKKAGDWIKHYRFNITGNTLQHFQNCRMMNNREECAEVKLY